MYVELVKRNLLTAKDSTFHHFHFLFTRGRLVSTLRSPMTDFVYERPNSTWLSFSFIHACFSSSQRECEFIAMPTKACQVVPWKAFCASTAAAKPLIWLQDGIYWRRRRDHVTHTWQQQQKAFSQLSAFRPYEPLSSLRRWG